MSSEQINGLSLDVHRMQEGEGDIRALANWITSTAEFAACAYFHNHRNSVLIAKVVAPAATLAVDLDTDSVLESVFGTLKADSRIEVSRAFHALVWARTTEDLGLGYQQINMRLVTDSSIRVVVKPADRRIEVTNLGPASTFVVVALAFFNPDNFPSPHQPTVS